MALMLGFNELILIQMMAVVADMRRGQGWLLHLCLGEMEHLFFDGGLVLAVKMIEHYLSVE